MKNLIILMAFGLLVACKALISPEKQYRLHKCFETFDFESWQKANSSYKGRYDIYYFKNGDEVYVTEPEVFILPRTSFLITFKEFYENKVIKQKGKYFGDYDLGGYPIKVGKWYTFDENGRPLSEADEDLKFGEFSYDKVLTFLDKIKVIDLKTGGGREKLKIDYYYSDTSRKKLWKIIIKVGDHYGVPNLPGDKGMRYGQNVKSYFLDGNTGAIIKGKDLLDYKEIIPDFKQ